MSQIQRDRLSKAELELEAKEKGIASTSKYTKQELIDMLDELESTKETVRKQQEEIDELKSKFAKQESGNSSTYEEYEYEEYWRKYVWYTAVLPWICAITIIGLFVTYIIMVINTFAVTLPLIFYWPFTEKYGRHFGRYVWSWYSMLVQVFIVIGVVILCFVFIGFFLIPSVYKLNVAIIEGREDRVRYYH